MSNPTGSLCQVMTSIEVVLKFMSHANQFTHHTLDVHSQNDPILGPYPTLNKIFRT